MWVDECGCHTSLTPLYARAPKGERAQGRVPRNRGPNTTLAWIIHQGREARRSQRGSPGWLEAR